MPTQVSDPNRFRRVAIVRAIPVSAVVRVFSEIVHAAFAQYSTLNDS